MATHDRQVSAERVIAAPPGTIFDLLADPAKHPVIDGSGTVKRARGNPTRLALGSTFGMGMRMGVPYLVRNKVVEFEEGRRIAWRHFGRHVWRYELHPVDGGTRVVETFDWRPAPHGRLLEAVGFPTRNLASMRRTLERLDEAVAPGATP